MDDPGSTGLVECHEARAGRRAWSCLLVVFVLAGLSACKEPEPEDGAEEGEALSMPVPDMADVLDITLQRFIGITYPKRIDRYPGLARSLHAYSDAMRGELEVALQHKGAQAVPYELSLTFTYVIELPHLVVVAANGSLYTGGSESEPRVRRFVWLLGEERLLSGNDLIVDPAGWNVVHRLWLQRHDDTADTRQETPPVLELAADDLEEWPFVPQLDDSGHLAGLSFVVPEVVTDGVAGSTLDVPVEILQPYLDPALITRLEYVRHRQKTGVVP